MFEMFEDDTSSESHSQRVARLNRDARKRDEQRRRNEPRWGGWG